MGNGDKVKAAKNGGGDKYRIKAAQIALAARKTHVAEKRDGAQLSQLRRFEDDGRGYARVTATGRQYEHEERMREEKAKRDAKAAKAKAWRASFVEGLETACDADGDAGETADAAPAVGADGESLSCR
jgi:hypothetical protein